MNKLRDAVESAITELESLDSELYDVDPQGYETALMNVINELRAALKAQD